jgi:hypothetical protein
MEHEPPAGTLQGHRDFARASLPQSTRDGHARPEAHQVGGELHAIRTPSARLSCAAAVLATPVATAATASQIDGGAKGGIADMSLCPTLSAQLKMAQFDGKDIRAASS